MTKLTTHVLDIYSGKPGAGIKVELYYFNNNKREMKKTLTLNEDGRAEKPLLEGEGFLNGKYELVFFIGDYFKNITKSDELTFLDDVLSIDKEEKFTEFWTDMVFLSIKKGDKFGPFGKLF